MLRKTSHFQAKLATLLDAILVAATMIAALCTHKFLNLFDSRNWFGLFDMFPDSAWLLILPIPIWLFFLDFFGVYDHILDLRRNGLRHTSTVARAAFLSLTTTLTLMYVFRAYVPRSFLILHALYAWVAIVLRARFVTPLMLRRLSPPQILLVGSEQLATAPADFLKSTPVPVRCLGLLSPGAPPPDCSLARLGGLDAFSDVLHHHVVDAVMVLPAGLPADAVESILAQCNIEGVEIWILPAHLPKSEIPPTLDDFNGRPLLVFSQNEHSAWGLFVKRLFDIAASAALLVLLSPLFLLFAILIRRSSPGPIFFSQVRSTRHGRTFRMHKFRTMVQNAESMLADLADQNEVSGPVFKIKNDPRVTPIGRFLRRYSLDELPQLWNVLVGDMSLVGPRPPIPAEVEQYEPWQRRRLSMRSGCTCLWQVGGRNALEFEDWMRLDLQYIDHWSLWLDFKILCKTFSAMFRGTGC